MSLFKCKMCGAALNVESGATVIECEYCGTQQTLPKLDDEKRANMYDRANHFRRNNEFDKAMGIYEQILNEDGTDAEAYWSLVLCRYGIEYVEDPASHKRVPTVNRAQFTSIFDDDNYKAALEYADIYQRSIYEDEAKAINEIQKDILAISQKEEPFDVFICYKETDNNGRRTPDSVLAQELYYQLVQEGFKVFFSRITLEDKLGTAYEPYIFAALNSAKVMVALGTKPEYFNAVWVKNEWRRYLALIKQGQKKMLIPAYKDMDPYDLPAEFSHLQAQDMSKLGFMQDLIRGIKKIVGEKESQTTIEKNAANTNIEAFLKRVSIFLEDGNWESADEYCEKVLDIDPENAEAYLGKLMAELKVCSKDKLVKCALFEDRNNYQKAVRYADPKLASELEKYATENGEWHRLNQTYNNAVDAMSHAIKEAEFIKLAETFKSISGFLDADVLAETCLKKAEKAKELEIIVAQKAEEERLRRIEREKLEAEEKARQEERMRLAQLDAAREREQKEAKQKEEEAKIKRIQKIVVLFAFALLVLNLAFACNSMKETPSRSTANTGSTANIGNTPSVSTAYVEDTKPTACGIESLHIFDEKGSVYFDNGTIVDAYGKSHTGSYLSIWTLNNRIEEKNGYYGFIDLVTGNNYKYFSGVFFPRDEMRDDQTIELFVYADNQLVYSSGVVNRQTKPVEFRIDIGQCDILRIEVFTVDYYYASTTGCASQLFIYDGKVSN